MCTFELMLTDSYSFRSFSLRNNTMKSNQEALVRTYLNSKDKIKFIQTHTFFPSASTSVINFKLIITDDPIIKHI